MPSNADFDALLATASDESTYGPTPPVNLPEAVQFRRMYTVANYVLAQLPEAITALNSRLTSNNNGTAPVFTNKSKLVADHGANIDVVLRMVNEEYLNRADFNRETRAWFDLGTESAPVVNVDFKTAFRNLATICADDLFGIAPSTLEKNTFDPESYERLLRLYRDAKRRIVDLIESMSDSGTLGSDRLISKWAKIVDGSLKVLQPVSGFVATDDSDSKHIWSVVADLVGRPRSAILPHIVHARQGGELLSDAIEVYKALLNDPTAMNEEDPEALKKIFGEPDTVFTNAPRAAASAVGGGAAAAPADRGNVAARRLRRNATFVLQSWPWG